MSSDWSAETSSDKVAVVSTTEQYEAAAGLQQPVALLGSNQDKYKSPPSIQPVGTVLSGWPIEDFKTSRGVYSDWAGEESCENVTVVSATDVFSAPPSVQPGGSVSPDGCAEARVDGVAVVSTTDVVRPPASVQPARVSGWSAEGECVEQYADRATQIVQYVLNTMGGTVCEKEVAIQHADDVQAVLGDMPDKKVKNDNKILQNERDKMTGTVPTCREKTEDDTPVSYTHLRAHET